MALNLTIDTEEALDDAKNIDSIVSNISSSLESLDKIIEDNIPEHVETLWSTKLLDEWKEHYQNSIKNSMEGMKASAGNLKEAVDTATNYSEN